MPIPELPAMRPEVERLAVWLDKRWPVRWDTKIVFVSAATLRRAHKARTAGDCICDEEANTCRIRIANSENIDEQCETLIAEWAHALRWQLPHGGDEACWHDSIYGAIRHEITIEWDGG